MKEVVRALVKTVTVDAKGKFATYEFRPLFGIAKVGRGERVEHALTTPRFRFCVAVRPVIRARSAAVRDITPSGQ